MPRVGEWIRQRTHGGGSTPATAAGDGAPPAAEPAPDERPTGSPLPLPRRSPGQSAGRTPAVRRPDPVATDPQVLRKVLDGLNRLESGPPSEPPPAPDGQRGRMARPRCDRPARKVR